jgi:hypothetical protein
MRLGRMASAVTRAGALGFLVLLIAGCSNWKELNTHVPAPPAPPPAAASAVSASSAPSTVPRKAAFVEEEYRDYAETGEGLLMGQAFATTRGGDVVHGAGRSVYLTPRTSYATEWWEQEVLRGIELAGADSTAETYFRVTTADAEGRFKFEDLPRGTYYVACWILWETDAPQGVCVGEIVTLGEKKRRVETILKPLSRMDADSGRWSPLDEPGPSRK